MTEDGKFYQPLSTKEGWNRFIADEPTRPVKLHPRTAGQALPD